MIMNFQSLHIFYIIIAGLIFLTVTLAAILIHTLSSRPNQTILDIQRKLGSLENSAATIQEIGKEVSSLQALLHTPKLRGNFGEYLLYNLLKDTLPPKNFSLQHSFSDGAKVDAIIRLGKNIISVDSKFPLESFERYLTASDAESKKKAKSEFTRSVKARIDEISKKYIRPEENTFDFALMYIPSESVYYEILTKDASKGYGLFDYAMKSRVIPVSPNTFYAYLMSVVYGLKGMKIDEQAKEIVKKLNGIQIAFKNLNNEIATLGKHITNAGAKFKEVQESADKIEASLENLTE